MAVPPPIARPDPAADKAALRTRLRAARLAFAAEPGGDDRNAALVDRLMPLLADATAIAGYVAHRGEPDIALLLKRAFAAGIEVALPHVGADRHMHFAPWHPDATLTPGSLGIPQPAAAARAIVPAIVLTPLVGFDRAGHRLGQGAGYYDRWFAAYPRAMRIGIAWSMQEVAMLPRDAWDMPLHAIATEKDWITP